MKTYHDIIDETVAFYSANPSRRSTTSSGCHYHGPNNRQCAFARYVTPETQPTLDILEGKTASYCLNPDGTNNSPICPPVQLLPDVAHFTAKAYFWNDLQHLHDTESYWITTGLSGEGQARVNQLKLIYSNVP